MQVKRLAYFIVIVVCVPLLLTSQTSSFIYYGIEDGLTTSHVQTIEQASDGHLFIGTISGVIKFNGKNSIQFTKNDGLAEDWVTASHNDKNGNLWFGHWAGGVTRYTEKTKTFESLELENYTRFRKITSITKDHINRLWISTEGAGVIVYDLDSNKLFSISKLNGLHSNNVYSICQDNKNNMWLAGDSGIVVYDSDLKINSDAAYTIIDRTKGLPSNHVTALKLINKNEMWIGTADSGIIVLNVPDKLSLKTSSENLFKPVSFTKANGLSSNFIESIFEDSHKNIWIASTGGGAIKIVPVIAENRFDAIYNAQVFTYSTKQGLNYFNTKKIMEDREGNIWIGTEMGLNQYRGEKFQTFTINDSLASNLIWAITSDSEGNVWLGTNEGVSKITFTTAKKNGKITTLVKNITNKNGLPANVVLSVHEDNFGNMWFGTGYGGACRLKKGSNTLEVFNTAKGLSSDVIYSIASDNKGCVWFGTKEGASCFNPISGEIKNYSVKDSLGGNNIYRIYKDSKGRMWFGALGGDLAMYDGIRFKKFGKQDGITHRFILSITEDKNGNIWLGTYGGAIYVYDGKTFTNKNTVKHELFKIPFSIVADETNNIWIGTRRGATKFNIETNTFSSYGKEEGFPSAECNPNSICKDKMGNIWFGTTMGAVKYNPAEDIINNVEPTISLTGLRIAMKDAVFPEDGKFSYNENHLTFTFVGVSLTTPKKVKYLYKLEGFDSEWLPEPTTHNEVVYSNLPAGKYTLLVKAFNDDGVGTKKPLRYHFVILPPFSQTATFYVLMGVFILFCLYGADKIRRRNIVNEKQQLAEKIKILTKENAELLNKYNKESSAENTETPE